MDIFSENTGFTHLTLSQLAKNIKSSQLIRYKHSNTELNWTVSRSNQHCQWNQNCQRHKRENCVQSAFHLCASSTPLHLEMHNYIPCTRLSLKLILQTTRKITRQIKSFVSVQFGSCLNAYLCASLPNTGMLLRTDIFSSWWWNSSSYFPHQG